MPKCQNCGRWTSITNDLKCPYCGLPIVDGDKINNAIRQRQLLQRIERTVQTLDQIGQEPRKSPKVERELLKIGILSLIYLFVFGYLEYVTYYMSESIGIIFSIIILLILILNASMIPIKEYQNFLIALGLFPLIRIVSLAVPPIVSMVLPVVEIPQIYWYFIMAITILISIIGITRYLDFSFSDIGLNLRKPLIQVIISLVGIGLGIVDYIILRPGPLVDTFTIQTVIIPAFFLIIATGFVEEMAFRGIMQKASYVLGSWGWIYIAFIYTITQIGYKSLYHVIFVFLVSILFGWVVKKTGSIIGTSISHGLLNVGLYLILPHMGIQLVFY